MRFLLVIALVAMFAYLLAGRLEASAGALVADSTAAPAGELVQGRGVEWWARRAVQARKDANARGRTIRRLKAELRHRYQPSSIRAIALASVAYRVSFNTLYRKASCETGGTFSPYAKNPRSTASGLFQFLTSTWASTPYGRYSIWDPYANALAAGWMHRVGRGGEWECQ